MTKPSPPSLVAIRKLKIHIYGISGREPSGSQMLSSGAGLISPFVFNHRSPYVFRDETSLLWWIYRLRSLLPTDDLITIECKMYTSGSWHLFSDSRYSHSFSRARESELHKTDVENSSSRYKTQKELSCVLIHKTWAPFLCRQHSAVAHHLKVFRCIIRGSLQGRGRSPNPSDEYLVFVRHFSATRSSSAQHSTLQDAVMASLIGGWKWIFFSNLI